jgi:peptide/nickel transport system substrate-binding protein
VGIEMKIKVLVTAEWVAAITAGRYDLSLSYMTRGDPAVLQTVLDPRYANRASLAVNAYAPETAIKAEQLFDDGTASLDGAKRAQAYGKLQDLLIDEGVAFPVYERLWQAATSRKVRDFTWTSEGFAQLNDIRLEP